MQLCDAKHNYVSNNRLNNIVFWEKAGFFWCFSFFFLPNICPMHSSMNAHRLRYNYTQEKKGKAVVCISATLEEQVKSLGVVVKCRKSKKKKKSNLSKRNESEEPRQSDTSKGGCHSTTAQQKVFPDDSWGIAFRTLCLNSNWNASGTWSKKPHVVIRLHICQSDYNCKMRINCISWLETCVFIFWFIFNCQMFSGKLYKCGAYLFELKQSISLSKFKS